MFVDNVVLFPTNPADLQAAFNSVNAWMTENRMAIDENQNNL
jgi:hypothetical protein